MQNVITNRERAREARLPGDGRLLGNRSLSRSAGRKGAPPDCSVPHRPVETSDRVRLSVDIGTSPSSGWIDATGHHRVTRARREESSSGAKIGELARLQAALDPRQARVD